MAFSPWDPFLRRHTHPRVCQGGTGPVPSRQGGTGPVPSRQGGTGPVPSRSAADLEVPAV
jgi:hypothetical protein